MQLTALLAAALAAAPSLVAAQGGAFSAVVQYYGGGGCTGVRDAYPVFGGPNLCTRIPASISAVSANVSSVQAGCSVRLYEDPNCNTNTEQPAPVNQCVQRGTPFTAAKVVCP